jgi:hypothetical protein
MMGHMFDMRTRMFIETFGYKIQREGIRMARESKAAYDKEDSKLLEASRSAQKELDIARQRVAERIDGTALPADSNVLNYPCEHCGAKPMHLCHDSKYRDTAPHVARKKGMCLLATRVEANQHVIEAKEKANKAIHAHGNRVYRAGQCEDGVRLFLGCELEVYKKPTGTHPRYIAVNSVNILGVELETEFSEQQMAYMMGIGCKVSITHRTAGR